MRRLLLLAVLACGLFLAGLATRQGKIIALALPVIALLAAAFCRRPRQLHLHTVRTLSSERVTPNTPLQVTLTVTNEGPALEEVILVDTLPPNLELREGSPRVVTALAAGQTIEWSYTVQGRRGYYFFPSLWVTASDALGLFRRQEEIATPGSFRVVPLVGKAGRVAIRPQRTRPFSGLVPARRGGPGVEFFGLRPYRVGDPQRWINWRACARHPESYFTNEFQQECVVDVLLVLDVRTRCYACGPDDSFFDDAVQAAAALAESFLQDGNRVGLLLFGGVRRVWIPAGYGRVQRERILRGLAAAELSDAVGQLDYLPRRFIPPGAQLVLFSPLLREDVRVLTGLLADGHRVLVISPDPVSYESMSAEQDRAVLLAARIARLERNLMLRQLQQAGIQVVNWSHDQSLQQALYTSLGRGAMRIRSVGMKVR